MTYPMQEFTQRIGEIFGFASDRLAARQTLEAMRQLAQRDECRMMGITARNIVALARTDTERIVKVYAWVVEHLRLTPDPPVIFEGKLQASEYIKTPCRMLAEIDRDGSSTGDCDDYAILLAALFRALNMRCGFCAVSGESPDKLDHVVAFVFDREREKYISLDPQGWKPEGYAGKSLTLFVV